MPNAFHITQRHQGRGIEIYIDRHVMHQVCTQLGNYRRFPALQALRQLLARELIKFDADDNWSAESAAGS